MDESKYPAGLPEFCYIASPYSGRTVQIWRGERTLFGVKGQKLADVMNREKGVTKQQVAAMVGGVECGWDSPQADPANYDSRGQYIGPVKGDTNGKERT